MRFYHGTSVRGWLGILKSGSMDSKKIGDSRVSALYSKFKGNYLTTNRKIAEMYASKAGKGVVLEIEYDPLAPGRVNNFKEQQAAGKDYFVEETPLQVDGPECTIDTKDPLMSKAKMRGDINKATEEIHMSENTERDLRNAWQKLDENMTQEAKFDGFQGPNKGVELKKASDVKYFPKIQKSLKAAPVTPSGKVGVLPRDPDTLGIPGGDTLAQEGVGVGTDEQWKLMSAYVKVIGQPKMLGRISGDSDALGDVYQDAVNYFTQNPDMLPPDVTLPSTQPTREPEDFYDDGIMESIDHSLELLKKLKK